MCFYIVLTIKIFVLVVMGPLKLYIVYGPSTFKYGVVWESHEIVYYCNFECT
jgi:hypothetical protein